MQFSSLDYSSRFSSHPLCVICQEIGNVCPCKRFHSLPRSTAALSMKTFCNLSVARAVSMLIDLSVQYGTMLVAWYFQVHAKLSVYAI